MFLLNCVLICIKLCTFTKSAKLHRILNPLVHELLACATAAPYSHPHSLWLQLSVATCLSLQVVIRTMKWKGPVPTGARIYKRQSEKTQQRSPEDQLDNKLGHLQADP